MAKKKLPREVPKLDWKAIWAELDERWDADEHGSGWGDQQRIIQQIINKHVLKLLKEKRK